MIRRLSIYEILLFDEQEKPLGANLGADFLFGLFQATRSKETLAIKARIILLRDADKKCCQIGAHNNAGLQADFFSGRNEVLFAHSGIW